MEAAVAETLCGPDSNRLYGAADDLFFAGDEVALLAADGGDFCPIAVRLLFDGADTFVDAVESI